MNLNSLKRLVVVGVISAGLCLSVILTTHAEAATLQWDRNAEEDMRDYQVWACETPNCVVIKAPANLKATVPQTAVGVAPQWVIPATLLEGTFAVSARDESLNESGLSVLVPFDQRPPAVPSNPRLTP